jgi:hypothetical protein
MPGSVAGKSVCLDEVRDGNNRLFSRKIWLPKILYSALPWFYIGSGIAAFLATLYISAWFWILPHYLLFSVACVHLGLLIYRRRQRHDAGEA